MHRTRALILTVSLAAMLALAGGAALASGAIPGSDGVIHGCYNATNGQLRVVDPATTACKNAEVAIQWNQTGPQGPQGDQGPKGDKGDQGDAGAPGQDGQAGAPGANGADGRTILSGHAEPDASIGKAGDFYLYIDKSLLYGPKTNDAWGDPTSLVGQQGAPGADGADGKTLLNGSGAPAATLGHDGDFYIDTAANAIYGPKANGAWGNPTSLVGPQGEKGEKGDTGPQGPQGPGGFTTVTLRNAWIQPDAFDGSVSVEAHCLAGEVVTGGGFDVVDDNQLVHVTASKPATDNGWKIFLANADPFANHLVEVYVLCAS